MNKERPSFYRSIRFPKPDEPLPKGHKPQYLGQVGEYPMTGVVIHLHENVNKVVIHPLTVRNDTTHHCRMEVPFDKATLLELSAKFALLAEHVP